MDGGVGERRQDFSSQFCTPPPPHRQSREPAFRNTFPFNPPLSFLCTPNRQMVRLNSNFLFCFLEFGVFSLGFFLVFWFFAFSHTQPDCHQGLGNATSLAPEVSSSPLDPEEPAALGLSAVAHSCPARRGLQGPPVKACDLAVELPVGLHIILIFRDFYKIVIS